MTSATFGPGFLPELREILLSIGQGISYGADGEPTEVRDEPFLEQWRLRRMGYDPERGRSRVVCVLTAADGRDVTATIDAGHLGLSTDPDPPPAARSPMLGLASRAGRLTDSRVARRAST